MSVSPLESLSNEILLEIIEKYINGLDIINAFAFQLNQRFDALIIRSQRLRFNFSRCHKDHFRLCMGLLPAYLHEIETLALAEQFTPGQIHAFLSFYPSFGMFPQLEYLLIFTKDFGNVPLIETYLPLLRSLTIYSTEFNNLFVYNINERGSFDHSLRERTNFLFQRDEHLVTIWID